MSFESYAHHLSQKHRLAIALAVLKDKPESVSIQSYLEELRNKINDDTSDSEFTVCSDDFNLDDDSIKNNNDLSSKDNKSNTQSLNIVKNVDIVDNNYKILINDTTSDSQESISILNNFPANDLVINNDRILNHNDITSNRNITIVKDVIVNDTRIRNNDTNTNESISLLRDVVNDNGKSDLDVLKIVNNEARTIEDKTQTKMLSQKMFTQMETQDLDSLTYCDSYDSQMYQNAQNDFSNITEILQREQHVDLTVNKFVNAEPIHINVETQNYTHVSQSQYESIEINENLFKKVSTNAKPIHIQINEDITFIPTTNKESLNKSNQMIVDTQMTYYKSDNNEQYTQDIEQSLEIQKTAKINEQNERINEHNEINEHNDEINEDSQTELIPFKVIEELNKVKSYLNKVVDRRKSVDGSSDSGYKSDSQSRSSFKNSSQSSVTFLNQSAHCLFDFIVTAPVLVNAEEIVNEIAQVLAQLIDRLHEEEKYLVFLDELLEKIDYLLKEIVAGSCDENLLLKKDEDIQRLLLINISPNIQKYTIAKIIKILEEIHSHLSNTEEIYEISHTEECENLCYIFNILEVLLKRYIKKKDILTPKSSQTDLKKSSITDIWRKKWNPNFRNSEIEDVNPKACVLTICSEVLNKLVVLCMNGYSLISYAALQCFNILHL